MRSIRTIYTIASDAEAAAKVALLIAQGKIPDVYAFKCDCLASWRSQPSYLDKVYFPYATSIVGQAAAPERIATARLV